MGDDEFSMYSCDPTLTLVPMAHTEMQTPTDNPLQGYSYTPYTHNPLSVSHSERRLRDSLFTMVRVRNLN